MVELERPIVFDENVRPIRLNTDPMLVTSMEVATAQANAHEPASYRPAYTHADSAAQTCRQHGCVCWDGWRRGQRHLIDGGRGVRCSMATAAAWVGRNADTWELASGRSWRCGRAWMGHDRERSAIRCSQVPSASAVWRCLLAVPASGWQTCKQRWSREMAKCRQVSVPVRPFELCQRVAVCPTCATKPHTLP